MTAVKLNTMITNNEKTVVSKDIFKSLSMVCPYHVAYLCGGQGVNQVVDARS